MFLAVDIGNSHTSIGVFEGNSLIHHWRKETNPAGTADEIAAFVLPLLDHVGLRARGFKAVAICSVVPALNHAYGTFCSEYLALAPFFVSPQSRLNFKLRVEEPQSVGADRIANAVYAISNLKLPAIVVDFGTATTFDVISIEGHYEGGAIIPGIRLAFESLSRKTSQLPMVDLKFPKRAVGKSTTECIQAGILLGYLDLVSGMISRIEEEIGAPCEVALTGGFSDLFHPHLKRKALLLPHLTLEGIRLLYESSGAV